VRRGRQRHIATFLKRRAISPVCGRWAEKKRKFFGKKGKKTTKPTPLCLCI
jgi:hypothetical protein